MARRLYLWVDESRDACLNMGIDEAMLYEAGEGVAIIRLYWFDPHAATIGYFQRLLEAVNLDACRWFGVDVVRRFTGGGSVYHDTNGEATYSISVPLEIVEGMSIEESFRFLSHWLLYAIESFGVKPVFEGYNDIVVEGYKVSGNAQARRGDGVLQHGTLMYATRLDIMSKVLKVPPGKQRRIQSRVSTLSRILGRRVERREVLEALISSIRRWALENGFEVVEVPRRLRERLISLGKALAWKYCSREWLWRR